MNPVNTENITPENLVSDFRGFVHESFRFIAAVI